MHFNVTRSLSGRQEGALAAGTGLTVLVHLVIWLGCSQPFGGNVEMAEKREIYNRLT